MWVVGWVEVGDQPWRLYLFLQIYDPYTTLAGIVPAWSLNTEVSFYLFLPLWAALVDRVARRWSPGPWVPLAGTGVLVVTGYVSRALFSASDRVWAIGGDGQPVLMRQVSFSWLPNTIDLFAIGMALAVVSVWAGRDAAVRHRLDRLAATAAPWWAGAVVVWLTFAYVWGEPSLNGGYQGAYWQVRQAAFGLVGLCLLVPATFGDQARGTVRRTLRSPVVVWVGTVSYGLYLWHLDILQEIPGWLGRPFDAVPLPVLFGLTLGLGLVAAAASWYGLERPLQVLRPAHAGSLPGPPMRDGEAGLT
jgi:peptidoglycan/LPS O-acetylase OafA/YrhL